MDSSVFICIPAYNEEMSIGGVIIRCMTYTQKIVVCDDGSQDYTGIISKKLGAFVITHKENLGKGVAIKSAFTFAIKHNPKIIVMIDGDGQHDPDDIPKLIHPIIKGEADMVIGSRFIKGSKINAPGYRIIGLCIINFFSRLSMKYIYKFKNQTIKDTQSGFRAFSKDIVRELIKSKTKGYGIETEQILIANKLNYKIKEVPVNIRYKGLWNTSKKQSVIQGIEIIDTILWLIIEKRPLFFLGVPGAFLSLIGFLFSIYLFWGINVNNTNSTFLILTIISIMGGLLLIMTSMIFYAIKRK